MKDIDIDLAPSKRPFIFQKIREERGELGLVQVCTFGTEGTKSAIQTACRGYRAKDPDTGVEMYPDGIDVDTAQYLSSLIPSERGFLWSIQDVYYGNNEKDRRPIKDFINTVNQYPGLLDIIINIDGLVKQRGIHASGTVLYNNDFLDLCSLMRAPSGELITCWDLHSSEIFGNLKYDFLLTEISDKIIACLDLLSKDKVIDNNLSLREQYNQFLHPEHIDTTNEKIWSSLADGSVLDVFQFSSGVGLAVAKKTLPRNPVEMTSANALMRLMSEPGVESQIDRYIRIKEKGIQEFEKEMSDYQIPDNIKKVLHKYCDKQYGCSLTQEQLMRVVMDENITNFSLKEANSARKIVAKKRMSEIPALKDRFYSAMDKKYADYIWGLVVAPQLGYSFAEPHALAYSFVGIQTIVLATQFDPIYWNTACLIINSGSSEDAENGSTDYGKIAKAIGDIRSRGIKVSLVDINSSSFGFSTDVKNHQILFGLKGMLNVGDDVVKSIIENRPYASLEDFLSKVSVNKQAMISLIKGGAFDKFDDRKNIMIKYLWMTCDKKKRITLQNMASLTKKNLLPEILNHQRSVFEFNRYLKDICKSSNGKYLLDNRAVNFIQKFYDIQLENNFEYNKITMDAKSWEKIYQNEMDVVRKWMKDNQEEALYQLNKSIFMEDWEKYATGNYSSWEMEVLCFYYHDHELKNVDKQRYGISDFDKLPEEPVVEKSFRRGGIEIPIYRLNRIVGTCIAKNKIKSSISLLTPNGVVNVRFRNEYFSLFDRQISARQSDGTRKVIEKSWFNRGSMLMITGMRRGDEFVPKKYASTQGHQLYKIDSVNLDGSLLLRTERAQGQGEDSDE